MAIATVLQLATPTPTRAFRRRCSACGMISSSTAIEPSFAIMSGLVLHVSATRQSPCIRPACSNPSMFHNKFGQTSLWTSWRGGQRCMEKVLSSLSSTARKSTHTSSHWVTCIQQHRWPARSSLKWCTFIDSQLLLSMIVTQCSRDMSGTTCSSAQGCSSG